MNLTDQTVALGEAASTRVENSSMINAVNCQKLRSTAPSNESSGKWELTSLILKYTLKCLPHLSNAGCIRLCYTISAADGVGELLT